MANSNLTIGLDLAAQASQKIAQIVKNEIISMDTASVRACVRELFEADEMREEKGPLTCTQCKFPLDKGYPCRNCGYSGIDDTSEDIPSEDDDDPERPVHEAEQENMLQERQRNLDLPAHFEELLLESGLDDDDAIKCGLILCNIWENFRPANENDYKRCLEEIADIEEPYKEILSDTALIDRVLLKFIDIKKEEALAKEESDATVCEIRILQDDAGKWTIEIEDPLCNLMQTDKKGRITLGTGDNSITITKKAFLSNLKNRPKNLRKMAKALLEMRKKYFEAESEDDASEILEKEALEQIALAKKADIPASTLNKWCSKNVWIFSPHGARPLREFFSTAGYSLEEKKHKKISFTLDEVKERIKVLKDGSYNILEDLKKDGIEMSKRTLRKHLSDIAKYKEVIET